ncbi:hypothetical protein CONLIGDRAFT_96462 [Coniochaeta ligniaria NRRL 30616]|uniref:Uncharacterized protein n=1 Tax=Coniochaeta ligniaria NRRL 30616 TaxID=1408157 RepID=A0A1J7J3K5_9PEZI|nr:hypothetical protein CONLIGDRAFT_96462 [Coniochaeta ligniaria NRRL 30616]
MARDDAQGSKKAEVVFCAAVASVSTTNCCGCSGASTSGVRLPATSLWPHQRPQSRFAPARFCSSCRRHWTVPRLETFAIFCILHSASPGTWYSEYRVFSSWHEAGQSASLLPRGGICTRTPTIRHFGNSEWLTIRTPKAYHKVAVKPRTDLSFISPVASGLEMAKFWPRTSWQVTFGIMSRGRRLT